MKKIVFFLAFCALSATVKAEGPLWIRQTNVSPDGKTIAFTFKGDIYTVPVEGGTARAVTTNPAYDTAPVWSPDSKRIAFASNREGSMDIYLVAAEGGVPERLTTHSGHEYPIAFKGQDTVLFQANILPDAQADFFPSRVYWQVYAVAADGSRPVLYSSLPMESISIYGDKVLYHDVKSLESPFRKHQVSSATRDIWLLENGKHTKLTDFNGEDRNPVWTEDGKSFYFLSEADGTFNVYRRPLFGEPVQLTYHEKHPVRYLSVADDGTIVYNYDGGIYTLREGGEPRKIEVKIIADKNEKDVIPSFRGSGVTEGAVSPSGKEVAFVLRGDVYVASVEYGTTKRITDTPEEERNVSFSPDGRSLLYAAERNGIWNIYETLLVRGNEKQFAYATELKERALTNSGIASFQPAYSPSGDKVAYLEDRTELKVLDLKTNGTRTLLAGKYNFSYQDGDQYFEWSPDGNYILTKYIGIGGWNNPDVALVDVRTGEVTNLTESGYNDEQARWALDGKAIIWFSDRAGLRSHGSWGSTYDVYIKFFDEEAYDRFRMSEEELALLEQQQEEAAEPKKEKSKKKKTEEWKPDLENHRDRVLRLTINSSNLSDALLSKDGSKLYYLASFEGRADLWERDFKENTTRILIKGTGGGSLVTDQSGEQIFLVSGSGIRKIDVASGMMEPVEFTAQFDLKPAREREYMFSHIWQLIDDKFYVENLHGVDWEGYREAYAKFLPSIDNNYDFADLLSEMLGELNASHTGARYYAPNTALPTATLAAFFDNDYDGDGLKIEEIIKGSPLQKAGSKIKAGDIIRKIDGKEILRGTDYFPMLAGKADERVELTVYDPVAKTTFTEQVKPVSIGEESEMLYKRWVERRRETVEKVSGGKIGYVHVRGMDSESFRDVYSDVLGRYRNYDAIVVDTRHNSGGWLHDDLVTLLGGKEYQRYMPRGRYVGSDPFMKWTKPSIVLQGEDNYSNAHGFPLLYKTLGIGKLVGAPVPGTMTAVWWENQIDPTILFGIPQVGVQDMEGRYMENVELEPDILIYNTPEKQLAGEDEQLLRAVEELMK